MKPHKLSPIDRSRNVPEPSTHQAKRNSGGKALIPTVQSAGLREFHYIPELGKVNRSWQRSIFPESQMGSGSFVATKIGKRDFPQRGLIEHDNVVRAFSSDRAYQSFHESVLPGRVRRGQNFLNAHPENCLTESISVTTILISNQKFWSVIPGESLQHLLRCPFRRGMIRNVEAHDSPAMMLQNNEHEQEPKV